MSEEIQVDMDEADVARADCLRDIRLHAGIIRELEPGVYMIVDAKMLLGDGS